MIRHDTLPVDTCRSCDGTGIPAWTGNSNLIACPTCKGSGKDGTTVDSTDLPPVPFDLSLDDFLDLVSIVDRATALGWAGAANVKAALLD